MKKISYLVLVIFFFAVNVLAHCGNGVSGEVRGLPEGQSATVVADCSSATDVVTHPVKGYSLTGLPDEVCTITVQAPSNCTVDPSLGHSFDFSEEPGIRSNKHFYLTCEPDPEPFTIITKKIVCENESYLPNWGASSTPITENTATEFLSLVNASGTVCELNDWAFQWAPQGTSNPGDGVTEAGTPWTTFTGGSVEIDMSLVEGDSYVWVREVTDPAYVPFTGANTTEDESAEMYCHTDTLKYDNYDRVDGIQAGETYYCIGFNAEIPPDNIGPIAVITGTTTVTLGDPVMLSATSSYDTDGTIVEYLWEFDGATSSADTMSHIYSATGTYPVVLTVTDDDGATSTATVTVEVAVEEEGSVNEGPTAVLKADPTTVYVDETVAFDAASSTDDVGIVEYLLEFGDGATSSLATTTHSYSATGTYSVVLTVTDGEGATSTDTVNVTVEEEEQGPYCGDDVCNGSETCSTCSQDCGACSIGGGGGGGWFPVLIISHEEVEYLGDGSVTVTWKTNLPATSQVVYGDDSINRSDLGSVPEYGYDSVNDESFNMRTSHSMLVAGLTHGTQYYFRPVSDKGGIAEAVGKEVTYTFAQENPTPVVSAPQVCNYLLEYIKLGANNNPVEVEKLEKFLNEFENENSSVNGIYEQADYEAVKRFQIKYREDILDPWNHDEATGYVYITTKKKVNELYCEREFPLTASQEAEVVAFKAMLQSITQEAAAENATQSNVEIEVVDLGSDAEDEGTETIDYSIIGMSEYEPPSATDDDTTSEDEPLAAAAAGAKSSWTTFCYFYGFIFVLILIGAIMLLYKIRKN
ncbi:MAG: PKD domain-containing protein [Candidatus Pacebacteria bacterium]|nr:PKD domain-containing protein [Candidatus Paceibacterota bacterium]